MERELTATALQPEITARFASLIERGALAHAYLLVGNVNMGTVALATEVALRLFCPHQDDQGHPDRTCPECQRVLWGTTRTWWSPVPRGVRLRLIRSAI